MLKQAIKNQKRTPVEIVEETTNPDSVLRMEKFAINATLKITSLRCAEATIANRIKFDL